MKKDRLQNCDSPGIQEKDSPYLYRIGTPDTHKMWESTAPEVMTSKYDNRGEVVSGIRYLFFEKAFDFVSPNFSRKLEKENLNQNLLLNKVKSILTIRSTYHKEEHINLSEDGITNDKNIQEGAVLSALKNINNNEEEEEEEKNKYYYGSGLLFQHENEYYVITARHNVLSKRKSSKELQENDLVLSKIQVTFCFTQSEREKWYDAVQYNPPQVPSSERTVHEINQNSSWEFNSDFAILRITSGNNFNKIIKPEILKFKPESVPGNGSKVFVFGSPGFVTETVFKTLCRGKSYEEFLRTFTVNELNVSYGEIITQNDTLCTYDANTAAGMSGGPVFYIKDDELIPIGLHVGGSDQVDGNFFIPFSTKELKDEIDKIINTSGCDEEAKR